MSLGIRLSIIEEPIKHWKREKWPKKNDSIWNMTSNEYLNYLRG